MPSNLEIRVRQMEDELRELRALLATVPSRQAASIPAGVRIVLCELTQALTPGGTPTAKVLDFIAGDYDDAAIDEITLKDISGEMSGAVGKVVAAWQHPTSLEWLIFFSC